MNGAGQRATRYMVRNKSTHHKASKVGEVGAGTVYDIVFH